MKWRPDAENKAFATWEINTVGRNANRVDFAGGFDAGIEALLAEIDKYHKSYDWHLSRLQPAFNEYNKSLAQFTREKLEGR